MKLKNCLNFAFTVFLLFIFTYSGYSQEKKHDYNHLGKTVHWSYEGKTGPEHWGELSPEFAGCSRGMSQTPIDINVTYKTDLRMIKNFFNSNGLRIINNGHTVQVNIPPGSKSIIDGKEFDLLQFHFHTPSEHTVNGKHYPMEMHLVHKNAKGELGVIGVFFKEGRENPVLQTIIKNFPDIVGKEMLVPSVKINATDLLPGNKKYYHYFGSLTTPPCSEGVNWVVMKIPVEASKQQIEKFAKILHKNNRPVMPLNYRFVLEAQ